MSNSKRRCTGCKCYFPSEQMIQSPAGLFCDRECQIAYATKPKNIKRLVSIGQKEQRKETRRRKEELRPRSWYLKEAQSWFNRFIRLRDSGEPCISCDKPDSGDHQRHASHYRSVGACSYLRFDESNVHASCSQCNNWLSGNISGYTPRLIAKIGQEEFERIESATKTRQWSIDDLKEIIQTYKDKCKKLEGR